jgi:hypothetical protein
MYDLHGENLKLIKLNFAGELVIAEAKNVLFFVPLSERNHGWSGSLVVTNFKLSFITRDGAQKEVTIIQIILLWGKKRLNPVRKPHYFGFKFYL